MSSKFLAAEGLPEAFKKDMGLLASLAPGEISALAALTLEIAAAPRAVDEAKVLADSDLVRGLGLEKTRACLAATDFIRRGLRRYGDAIETVLDDIVLSGAVPGEMRGALADYFRQIQTAWEQRVRPRLIERVAVTATLPWWNSISSVVDLRAVIPNSYKISDPVELYDPTCIDFTPVVIISLSVKDFEDHIASVTFQADEDSLGRLIAALVSAQKDLKAAKRAFDERAGKGGSHGEAS